MKYHIHLILTCVILFSTLRILHGSRVLDKKKIILDDLFSSGKYDSRIRPNGTDSRSPVVVTVNIYFRWLDYVDISDMAYTTQVTFRQKWTDSRLQFSNTYGMNPYIIIRDPKSIWTPDTFFSNEKESRFHDLLSPNSLIRIYPNGEVLFSIRISLKMACMMDLRNFPMDTQTCRLILASYGYTTDDVQYVWKQHDPVQLSKTLEVPQYRLGEFVTDTCNSRTNTGEYSCLKVNFKLKREFHVYLSQLYIPSIVLVAVSWFGFWLHVNTPSVRVTLPLVGLFLLGCMSLRSRAVLDISYTTSLDVWIDTCAIFLLFALVEYFIARWMAGKHNVTKVADLEGGKSPESKADESRLQQSFTWLRSRAPSQRIDIVSRVLFPFVFLVFNIYYWATYPTVNP